MWISEECRWKPKPGWGWMCLGDIHSIPKYGTCWKVNYSIVQYQKWHRAGSHLLMLALHIIYEIQGDVDKYIISLSTETSSCFWAFAVSLCWYDKVNLMFVACRKGKVQVLFSTSEISRCKPSPCLLNYLSIVPFYFSLRSSELWAFVFCKFYSLILLVFLAIKKS